MSIPITTVDAFTDRPFSGNPAAVCWLDEPRDAAWMQSLAAEMNLSETAFVSPAEGGVSLRWFTPAVEVPLCGHATLASAHALWSTSRVAAGATIRFFTASGELVATSKDGWIALDFPRYEHTNDSATDDVTTALGVTPVESVRLAPEAGHAPCFIVRLENERAVRDTAPDFAALRETGATVSVTAEGDASDVDFVSRFFAPQAGIDEDPVTGAAHCWLAPFWTSRLGRQAFTAHQVSARGGTVRVTLAGERVRLEGQAVTVMEARLLA